MLTLQDFKYALRLLSKRPSFTILTITVMAVGLGLSVYLFSFLNSMAYKDLPFEDSDSLVTIDMSLNGNQFNGGSLDIHDFYEVRNNVKGFSETSAVSEDSVNVSTNDGARRYNASRAEANMFEMTRTKPILGRVFTADEDRVGADNVVVIGYDIWQNQYGGDPDVLTESFRINGTQTQIIGVMPEGYYFPRNAEMWMPLRRDASKLARGNTGNVSGIAHLAPGVTIEAVNLQMSVIMKRLEQEFPKSNTGLGSYATTYPLSTIGQGSDVFLGSMFTVAILLLLLASINVGNLLLSRAIERCKETAIRVALGAPRKRLIGQMLWESIIICTTGGIIGLLVVAWGLEITESITATFTDDKPFFWWKFAIDAYTLKIFALFLLATIIITGLLPAWKNSDSDFNEVLRDGTRGALGKKSGRLNRILVISEVFISLTVLIVASVMVVGTYIATHADYGAKVDNILTARVRLPENTYDTREKRAQFAVELQRQLANSSGIGEVAITSKLPGDNAWTPTIAIEGVEYVDDKNYSRANYIHGTVESLEVLGVELKHGRYFNSSDNGFDKSTVIVTESFAHKHFPEQSALGKRVRIVETDGDEPKWLTIVGVVVHTIQGQSFGDSAQRPSIFRPLTQRSRVGLFIAMKMTASETIASRSLRETLKAIDADLPAYLIKTYQTKIDRNSAGIGFASKIFLAFAIVAVILAASGIYGVMSNTISQRTQEIGVKRALGANENMITKDYLLTGFKQLLWGAIPGLLAGCGVGFALSKLMSTGIIVLVVIAITMVTIIGVTLMLATYFPTRRALKMEPAEALHYE